MGEVVRSERLRQHLGHGPDTLRGLDQQLVPPFSKRSWRQRPHGMITSPAR